MDRESLVNKSLDDLVMEDKQFSKSNNSNHKRSSRDRDGDKRAE